MGKTKRPYPRQLARKLKRVRLNLGLSQTGIAKSVGVQNRSSIAGYESGEREPPLPVLLKYARLAGVIVDVLIDDKMRLPR
jgi:transcriptional regulator with XRE-family HTH domain